MSMLESEPSYESGIMMTAERCKPDYEGMIKRIKAQLDKTNIFLNATLNYFEGKKAKDKMAELIGELVTSERQLQREYESLIEAQEKDKA